VHILEYILKISVPTLNPIVKNCEETVRSFVQCGPAPGQQKLLKCSPLEELESALVGWFKQARKSNASIDGSHLKVEG
jgi:hypothetical protein